MSDLFMGEYTHSIDPKGRIIVPSKFRELLGENFVVTKGLDCCLWVFPEEEWDGFSERLHSLQTSTDKPISNSNARTLIRFFMGGAAEVETDKQGRILLSQSLREHAKLKKDVVLVGVSSRVEIWDKEEWENVSGFNDVEAIAENLGEMGFGF